MEVDVQLKLTLSVSTKQCRKCGQTLPLSDFSRDRSRRDGLFLWCKPCSRASTAARRPSPEEQCAKQKTYRDRQSGVLPPFVPTSGYKLPDAKERKVSAKEQRRINRKAFVRNVKIVIGCQVCGEREPAAIDFHHLDPTTKRFIIGKLAKDLRLVNVIEEMLGCCCICANCHRKYHAGVLSLDGIQTINREQIDKALRQ